MKKLFIIPLFLMLFCCNSGSNNTQTGKESVLNGQTDTIVGVQVVPAEIAGAKYIEKEYFVVMKNDTSSFSCIISENKINGKMSMHYRPSPYGKMLPSFFLDDTAAVAEHEPVKKSNHKSNYEDQIRELKLILDYASKDYDLSKLGSVRLTLGSINGLSQNVLEKYVGQYGAINYRSNQKVATLIENSKLRTDLNKILSFYSLIINKISVDGLMYFVPQDSQAGTKPVLDGMIIFSLIVIH